MYLAIEDPNLMSIFGMIKDGGIAVVCLVIAYLVYRKIPRLVSEEVKRHTGYPSDHSMLVRIFRKTIKAVKTQEGSTDLLTSLLGKLVDLDERLKAVQTELHVVDRNAHTDHNLSQDRHRQYCQMIEALGSDLMSIFGGLEYAKQFRAEWLATQGMIEDIHQNRQNVEELSAALQKMEDAVAHENKIASDACNKVYELRKRARNMRALDPESDIQYPSRALADMFERFADEFDAIIEQGTESVNNTIEAAADNLVQDLVDDGVIPPAPPAEGLSDAMLVAKDGLQGDLKEMVSDPRFRKTLRRLLRADLEDDTVVTRLSPHEIGLMNDLVATLEKDGE